MTVEYLTLDDLLALAADLGVAKVRDLTWTHPRTMRTTWSSACRPGPSFYADAATKLVGWVRPDVAPPRNPAEFRFDV